MKTSRLSVLCVVLSLSLPVARADEVKPSVADLIRILEDPDKSTVTKEEALRILEKYRAEAEPAIPALKKLLQSRSLQVRTVACLGAIGKPAVPVLADAWKGQNVYVRRAVADALGSIGPEAKEAIPALLEWIKADEPYAQRAAQALNKISPEPKVFVPAAIEVITKRLAKKDTGWYGSAAETMIEGLGKMGPAAKDAVPILIKVLEAKVAVLPTINALAAIGTDSKPALLVLRSYLDNREFGRAAEKAIEKIKGDKSEK
jgi:HEAT repeat protein